MYFAHTFSILLYLFISKCENLTMCFNYGIIVIIIDPLRIQSQLSHASKNLLLFSETLATCLEFLGTLYTFYQIYGLPIS